MLHEGCNRRGRVNEQREEEQAFDDGQKRDVEIPDINANLVEGFSGIIHNAENTDGGDTPDDDGKAVTDGGVVDELHETANNDPRKQGLHHRVNKPDIHAHKVGGGDFCHQKNDDKHECWQEKLAHAARDALGAGAPFRFFDGLLDIAAHQAVENGACDECDEDNDNLVGGIGGKYMLR